MSGCCVAELLRGSVKATADGECPSTDSFDILRESIPSKAETSIQSTLRGRVIERNDECENADFSMRFNDDGDSNEIVSSDRQYEKHFERRISTPDGIIIDRNDEK
jgi:hypothetical protein